MGCPRFAPLPLVVDDRGRCRAAGRPRLALLAPLRRPGVDVRVAARRRRRKELSIEHRNLLIPSNETRGMVYAAAGSDVARPSSDRRLIDSDGIGARNAIDRQRRPRLPGAPDVRLARDAPVMDDVEGLLAATLGEIARRRWIDPHVLLGASEVR